MWRFVLENTVLHVCPGSTLEALQQRAYGSIVDNNSYSPLVRVWGYVFFVRSGVDAD